MDSERPRGSRKRYTDRKNILITSGFSKGSGEIDRSCSFALLAPDHLSFVVRRWSVGQVGVFSQRAALSGTATRALLCWAKSLASSWVEHGRATALP